MNLTSGSESYVLTGQNESDESKDPVAAPEDDAGEDDVSNVRVDLMSVHGLLIRRRSDHNHVRRSIRLSRWRGRSSW